MNYDADFIQCFLKNGRTMPQALHLSCRMKDESLLFFFLRGTTCTVNASTAKEADLMIKTCFSPQPTTKAALVPIIIELQRHSCSHIHVRVHSLSGTSQMAPAALTCSIYVGFSHVGAEGRVSFKPSV